MNNFWKSFWNGFTHPFSWGSPTAAKGEPTYDATTRTLRMGNMECPSCSHKINAGLHLSGQEPGRVGDLGVCNFCGAVLEFNKSMKLQLISEKTWNDLPDGAKTLIMDASRSVPFVTPSNRKESGDELK